MKGFSPLPVVMIMAGIILIYAAIKDVNPKTVIQNALQGKATVSGPTTGLPKGVKPPPSGFDPGAGAGKGGGNGGGGSW